MKRTTRLAITAIGLVTLASALVLVLRPSTLRDIREIARQMLTGKQTVSGRVHQYGVVVRDRLAPEFARLEVPYPPAQLRLVGIKKDRRLEVWVSGDRTAWGLLRTYPILALSGTLGPKLREGDLQAPEGIYSVESLNPNSAFHLALRVGYPNEFDRAQAERDGRPNLGSDIMIHGGSASIGCLAMGDEAAEDLFVLAADTGIENVTVILTPVDFRNDELPADMPSAPAWTSELYDRVARSLRALSDASPKKDE